MYASKPYLNNEHRGKLIHPLQSELTLLCWQRSEFMAELLYSIEVDFACAPNKVAALFKINLLTTHNPNIWSDAPISRIYRLSAPKERIAVAVEIANI